MLVDHRVLTVHRILDNVCSQYPYDVYLIKNTIGGTQHRNLGRPAVTNLVRPVYIAPDNCRQTWGRQFRTRHPEASHSMSSFVLLWEHLSYSL